jgi:hypothetical protein
MISFTGDPCDPAQIEKVKKHPGWREDDRSSIQHRRLIGYIGLFLPAILIVLVLLRDRWAYWKKLDSVSAYYYSGAVAAFVGMLVALALFLFTYRGYANGHNWADRLFSMIAGLAALCVAIFPTGAPDGVPPLSWWTELIGILHLVFAILLFLMFAVFAIFLFPIRAEGKQMPPGKRRRNRVYYGCGIAILACMVWAGINGFLLEKSIFWPESFALIFFAFSWLVKGRIDVPIERTVDLILRRKSGLKQ